VTVSPSAIQYRKSIIKLAIQFKLPAIYPYRFFATDGGLIAYGPDTIEPYRRAAGYVDRILKGEKPADLPVQAPTKYELAINLKTAKALGLTVPNTLIGRADEVIAMSAIGPKRTSLVAPHMSAFRGKADMACCGAYVGF